MLVQLLHFAVYCDDDRWVMDPWGQHAVVEHPKVDDIEDAIRRLDKDCYPYIWLYQAAHAEEDDPPDFNVIGGDGEYAFDCLVGDTGYRFFDPAHGDKEVSIWLSDQGAQFPEKYVCYDLAVVLQATR